MSFTVTFSEAVTGVNPSDFQVLFGGSVGATLTQVTPASGAVYTLTVSGITGNGTLGVNLEDNGDIRDLAGNPLIAQYPPATFEPQQTFAAAKNTISVALGDLTGDGKLDVVAANFRSDTLSVLLGNGDGTFQAQQTFATGLEPISVTLGDVNGDGIPDIVLADEGGNTVGVLLGNGNGTFQAEQTFAAGLEPISVALGDVTGDGKTDLVVANYRSNSVSVLLGNGNGTFQGQQTFATGLTPNSVAVGDVNGDGLPDIVAANRGSNTLSVLLGNGDGTFQTQQIFATGSKPFSVALDDVNGDGKSDIVVADAGSNAVSVLLGNGNGTFQDQQTFATGIGPDSLAVADVNGDGQADVVVANYYNHMLSVLLGNGNGTFQAQQTFDTSNGPLSVAVGDVNGDGRPDIVLAEQAIGTTNGTIGVFLNSANGDFTGPAYTIDTIAPYVESINRTTPASADTNLTTVTYTVMFSKPVTGVAAANFQLALGGTVTATVGQVTPVSTTPSGTVYTVTISGIKGIGTLGLNLVDNGSIRDAAGNPLTQQNAVADFQAQQTFATGLSPTSVVLGDLTGDGIPDIVSTNEFSNTVSVLLGNGNGTFQTQQTFATGMNPFSVALGDLTGNGKLDLVVANSGTSAVSVLMGNGNGTFQTQQTFAIGGFNSNTDELVLADLNGDGILDIVTTNLHLDSVSVLLGNGNGTFQTQQTYATVAAPLSLATADINGDGKPDIVVANLDTDLVSVLLGNGNGTFQAQQTFVAANDPTAVALSDLNGDGKPDIVTASYFDPAVSVLLGNGNGTFQAQQTFAAGKRPDSVTVGDVTGDGKPGLVVANHDSDTVSVLLGNGNGTFQAQQTFATASVPYSVALGDLTGDDRPDIVVANNGSNTVSVLLNATNGDFTGQVYTITPATNTSFIVTAPTQTTAGNGFVFTVAAVDQNGNPAPTYAGTVHFTSTDPLASLPADANLYNGTGYFAAVLNTFGPQTIAANDKSSPSYVGTSGAITVVRPATASFSIAANPRMIAAGSPVVFEVTALDARSNVLASFNGTVHFASSDAQASLPGDATLTNGIGFFSAILKTAGRQALYVSDMANGGATGTSAPITVTALAATHFGVSAPASAVTGNAFAFTVTALDSYGNIASAYAGTVHFASTDSAAALPPDSTLAAGMGIFTATLNTAGNFTLSATAAAGIAGTSSVITSRGLAVSGFTPTPTGFAVTFDKAFNPTTLSLYVGIPDVTLVNASGQAVRGSLVLNTAAGALPDTSFTFIATAGLLAAGTDTVTITGGLQDSAGNPCVTFVTTFTALAPSGAVLSIPDFARGPNSAANIVLPNNTGSGIPITLSNAVNVTAVTFTLSFNAALLNISGVSSGPSGTLTLVSNTAGVASFAFTSSTPLSGTLLLGNIIAQVPNSAAGSYKSKALLHLSDIVINGSITTATNKDGIEAVAYLGDVAGTGSFSPLDAALIGQTAVGADAGFAAYPLLDPAIIGDVSNTGNGAVDSTDVTLMNRLLAGIATPQIPLPPPGLTIPATGPDPTLRVAAYKTANHGNTITVPVNIDTGHPAGSSGLMEATLALRYNPEIYSITAADIKLGTVPNAGSGWQLGVAINPETGEIGITLFSTTPIQSTAGGSLVTITLQVKGTSDVGQPALCLVDEVDPTGLRIYKTGLADSQGSLLVTGI